MSVQAFASKVKHDQEEVQLAQVMMVDAGTSYSVIASKKKEYTDFGMQAFESKSKAASDPIFNIEIKQLEAPSETKNEHDVIENKSIHNSKP